MIGHYGGWEMGLGGWLWMIGGPALVIAVVVLIVWAATNVGRRADDAGRPAEQSPLDILRVRYARGEISAEEFEQAKRVVAS